MVPKPVEGEQVLLCDMIGRAIVLVKDDQLSQAIGKYGQNVRLASKLVGWDIEIMTSGELEEQIDRAVGAFMELEGMTDDLAQRLVEQGYLSYDDLSVIELEFLMEMGGISAEEVDLIVSQADVKVEAAEKQAEDQKQQKKRDAAEPKPSAAQDVPGRTVSTTEPKPPTDEQPATPEEETPPSAPEETMDQSNESDQNELSGRHCWST